MADKTPDTRMLVAAESFVVNFDGIDVDFKQNETRIRANDPRIKGLEHLFKPIEAHYLVEEATANPGQFRGDDGIIAA